MKTTICDLAPELVEEILFRVPLTSLSAVRSTWKQWNGLSKDRVVCKAEAKQQFLVTDDDRVCSVRFGLQNDEFVVPSVKKIGKLDQFEIRRVSHCDGLVLCLTKDYSRFVVWNPYLGQTRSIELRRKAKFLINYALGYAYSPRSPKILMVSVNYYVDEDRRIVEHEIYDFDSDPDSWRDLDVTSDCYIGYNDQNVSLKGNTYWIARDKRKTNIDLGGQVELPDAFLLCFDFTRERFGPRLNLPFRDDEYAKGALACVREEQLAVMFKHKFSRKIEIWRTTKIEPEFVSWSKFLVFDVTPREELLTIGSKSFFIDEEKKVAVLFYLGWPKDPENQEILNMAYMIRDDGYNKDVDLRELSCYDFCSYAPSLVQIE